MSKLVCESLDEFNLLKEADDHEGGPIIGAAKNVAYAVKAAPGRALRWARAVAIMKKYKLSIPKKINKTFEKYLPNIKQLVENIEKRYKAVETSNADESIKKNHLENIIKDGVDHMQEVLKSIKDALEGQLKVYADSIIDRLERTGTLTNVKFTPGQKRELLSQWKSIEDEAQVLMQKKFIDLMNDPKIAQFEELKAKMDAYIEQIRWNKNKFDFGEESDESTITDAHEQKIYDEIINTVIDSAKIHFDIPAYKIINKPPSGSRNSLNILPKPIPSDYIAFVIDNKKGKVAYTYYDSPYIRSKKDRNLYYFIDKEKGETYKEAKDKFDDIITLIKK